MLGIYLHVPFCASKCPYCDFYSLVNTSDEEKDRYVAALVDRIAYWSEQLPKTADTVYFGGGTPTLLGAHRLETILAAVHKHFTIPASSEITIEANPGDDLTDVLSAFAACGGNRVSLGVQAVNDAHLRTLGRRHTIADADAAVQTAYRVGIQNLSLDLMLGTAGQTEQDITAAAHRFADWGAKHVSAYLLKLESGTPYALSPPILPDDDTAASLYLTAVSALREEGFAQYEISNFAKTGFEARHNLKYWNLEPYIGIGPSAHSFINGKRFYYPRSLQSFLDSPAPLSENPTDGAIPENSPSEYAMLRLRLTEGLTEQAFSARFGMPIPAEWRKRAAGMPSHLVTADEHGIRFTPEGFLVSDALIARIL